MDIKAKDKSWKTKYALIYVYAVFVLGNIIIILGPLIPIKAANGGKDGTDYSIVFTLRGIGYVIGSFAVTKVEKKYGAHQIMTIASVAIAIICFLNVSENGIIVNAIQWFFMGLSCSFVEVLSQVSITVIYTEQINMWLQAVHFGFGIGAFIAPLLSTMMGANSLIVLGIFSLITAILMYSTVSPKMMMQQTKTEQEQLVKQQLPVGLIRMILVFFFLDVGFELTYGGWIPTFCTMTGVTNQKEAGLSASIYWLAMTVGRLIAIPLANKVKVLVQFRVLAFMNLITTFICLVLVLTNNLVILVYLGSAIVGLGFSAIYPLLMSLPGALGYSLSASNAAIFTVAGTSGQVALPVFVGFSMSLFGASTLFVILFVLGLSMYIIYFQIMKYEPEKRDSNKPLQMDLIQK